MTPVLATLNEFSSEFVKKITDFYDFGPRGGFVKGAKTEPLVGNPGGSWGVRERLAGPTMVVPAKRSRSL